jgi:hypothetical protein
MVDIIPPQTVLTPASAAADLQAEGLDALGLTVPTISPAWATATPVAGDLDAVAMTLTLTGMRAPFRAIRTYEATPSVWSSPSGASLAGPVAVLRLHPEAARRLAGLVATRYGNPAVRPTPVAMVVRGITLPDPVPVPEWYLAGESLGLAGSFAVSFHDERGLPIDPVAVAALLRDLIGWRPALRMTQDAGATEAGAGGLDGIVSVASGVRCHVIDPHGWAYVPTRAVARLKKIDAGNAEVATVPDGGLIDLAAGERLGRSAADDLADQQRPLRWGWAMAGTLDRAPLTPPALPGGVTLARQFLRVMAVDLDWHLLGNRTNATVAGIPGDDDKVPDFALPQVRQAVPNFDYLVDGMDVLGASAEIAAGFPPPGGVFVLAVSPTLNAGLTVPPATGAAGHWPAFPPPNTNAALPPGVAANQGVTARWRAAGDGANADLDVVVTVPADVVPGGTYLRVFPRRFVEIQSIGEQPSFMRGDGGAGIAVDGAATKMLLINPFGLTPVEPKPSPARLEVDIVVVSRTGQRRLLSVVTVGVDTTPEAFPTPFAAFGGQALLQQPAIAALFAALSTQSIAPVPLFGLRRTVTPPGGNPGSIIDMVRALASESQPRQGPRLPTQARFETILALGTTPVAPQLAWRSVLSGARWDWESRSARADLGDPGNPAGPDLHAAGVRCDGQLAYDLAMHAIKRAQPIVPLGPGTPGWLVTTGGNNWVEPGADAVGTVSAAMLETVAAICDTPELSFPGIPIPQPTDAVQDVVDTITNALGLPNIPVTIANEDQHRRRIQREMVTSKFGQRDAQWALRRAIGQAREFLYIESPAFARTARPSGAPQPHEVDLVELIRQKMTDNPRLKVMICLPRWPDFAPDKAPWVRAALGQRKEAIELLTTQDRNRVAAFHPIGFPGRPTAIRSTVVIVDDVWCLVGTSHFRRRGMTFDGAVDIVSIDRAIAGAYSSGIARFRQELMAAKLGVDVPASPATTSALWVRLARPESAFDAVADLLQQGGLGRCSPIWAGPTDTSVMPQNADVADPDGSTGANFLTLLASLLSDG